MPPKPSHIYFTTFWVNALLPDAVFIIFFIAMIIVLSLSYS